MEELIRQLRELGLNPVLAHRAHGLVTLEGYEIPLGKHAGKRIDLAIPAQDFPVTPPAGVHLRPHLEPIGQRNINASPAGPDWQYWSRRLPDWTNDRSAHHILSYVHKVLLDA